LYVGGDGPGNYSKIQDAIDNASAGDTIFVYSGVYYENVVVDKSINLVGENKYSTYIDGGGSGNVLYLTTDCITITGFTIHNGGGGITTMLIPKETYINISGNIIINNLYGGIGLAYAGLCTIAQNDIVNNGIYGVFVGCSAANIYGNNIANHECGVYYDKWCPNCVHGTNMNIASNPINYSIYHNNFCNNREQANYSRNISWDDGYPSGGNYWDDYTGTDENDDGIGDVPYDIPNGYNQDRYPLMNPYDADDHPYILLDGPHTIRVRDVATFNVTILAAVGFFYIDWGDGDDTGWCGPVEPGSTMQLDHSWSSIGDYEIRYKVKNIYGNESDWYSWPLSVPITYPFSYDDAGDEYYFEDVNVLVIGRCRTVGSDGTWSKALYIGPIPTAHVEIGDTWLERAHIIIFNDSITDPSLSFSRLTKTVVGVNNAKGIFFWAQQMQFSAGPIPPIVYMCCHAEKVMIHIY
jgi:hypothetical protein